MEQNGAGAGEATFPWEELLGSKDWSGRLSPLVPDLRDHLLRCGSFCQIAEDSCIYDEQSEYTGKCLYSPASILRQVFFKETADYVVDVDGYLYTTIGLPILPIVGQTNWMGYVAVSSDALSAKTGRRDIYVVWRGTGRLLEVFEDFKAAPVPFGGDDVKIMEGWHDIYTTRNILANIPSAQDHLKEVITHYLQVKYKDENNLSIICVGHSLGGSLAILSAFDIARSEVSKINGKDIQVCAVAFDAPKVGNQAFNVALGKLPKTKVLTINNANDIVPHWPFGGDYVKTGTILDIDSEKSAFLKSRGEYQGDQLLGKISQWHSLPVILHTVTGWRRSTTDDFDNKSELVKARLPLVNRIAGHLKVEHKVIEGWWVEKNKGMVYNEEEDKWEEAPVPRNDD